MDQELIVKLKGDISHLEQSFARAGQLMDRYSDNTSRAASSTQKFDRAGSDLNNTFGNMVKGYLGLSALFQGGQMFIDATAKVQKYENQLKVASGTQEDYAKNTSFLEGLADKYNKNILELGKSYAQLTIATRGTNLEGEKADRLFAAVTATSSALQMSVDETNGTFKAFIDMVSKGNVQAEELRGQLGDRLVGAFNLAAQGMGVSTAQLNKMLESGEVLASDLLPKLTTELEKTFGEQAQQNANNLASNIDYAKGQATLFFGEFGKTSGVTDGLNDMASAMGELFSWLRKLNTESGVVDGFFDRMFTLPGMKLDGGSKTLTPEQKAKAELDKIMAGMGKMPGSTFSSAQSTTDSNAYGAQYGIRDLNTKAEDKIRRANEIAARKAQDAIDKQVREWIEESKDRIANGIFEAESKINRQYAKNNSWLPAQQFQNNRGTDNVYSLNGGEMRKTGQTFTNEVTGDGSATNYDHIVDGMSAAIDKAIKEYARFQTATDEFEKSFSQSMKNALGNAMANTAQGVGELVAGLATGTSDLEDVGNTFAAIIATLLRQIADALVAYAAVKILANQAFKTGNPYVALAAAALAYGAAAVAESAVNNAGAEAAGYWTGGIIDGPGGRDRVPIMATKGEIMMNGSQQNRLWNFLSGASAPDRISGASGGAAAHGSDLTVTVRGRLKGGDIDLAGQQGNRNNNYFRVKRN